MKTKLRFFSALACVSLLAFALCTYGIEVLPIAHPAPATKPPLAWTYTLLPGSQLIDDCHCGRPTFLVPMEGTFQLLFIEENPLFAIYAVTNVAFTATTGNQTYKVTGTGRYQVGGEVALVQDMSLALMVDAGFSSRPAWFTNDRPTIERPWPMLKLHLDETNQVPIQFYRLDLAAAPFHELWFSTAHGFTPGVPEPLTNYIPGGDLVSSVGRVVKRNQDLTQRLGLMPSPEPPDPGLDGVDILPGGEIAFSIQEDVLSESLGPLHAGDVLSDRGRIVAGYAELSGAFGPEPPAADEGLDACHILGDGEIYFSITNDFFSERLGRLIRRGDLLSSRGVVVRTHEQILARFQPPPIPRDWGLDAIYVWPSGEIWFSVEEGFTDDVLGPIQRGDLLSDEGYVVYRNLDLLAPFQPLEDLADFGLDSLFIVTDTVPPPALPVRLMSWETRWPAGDLTLEWSGHGRVYQVEAADPVAGPYRALSPISTETTFTSPGALTNAPAGFYRVRQW